MGDLLHVIAIEPMLRTIPVDVKKNQDVRDYSNPKKIEQLQNPTEMGAPG